MAEETAGRGVPDPDAAQFAPRRDWRSRTRTADS